MTLHFHLEHFTSRLAREHADESAQVVVGTRVDLPIHARANALHVSSSTRPS
jgi:hypothetical protein